MNKNSDLRKQIVEMITKAREGHIPSSFSIVDVIAALYEKHLKFDPSNPDWEERDYFILSKGHGGIALFVVLRRYGFITDKDISEYSSIKGILGGHPDRTKVPGVEASTGSLGHGFPFAVGIALGLKIQNKPNIIFALLGDGECHEGTVWEAALVAQNLKLGNMCIFIDYNGSAGQILPHPNFVKQWEAFGWEVKEVDGHNQDEIDGAVKYFKKDQNREQPMVVIAHNIKGKGVSFLESHGAWHHKIPNSEEYSKIMMELNV
jgi:transketolase